MDDRVSNDTILLTKGAYQLHIQLVWRGLKSLRQLCMAYVNVCKKLTPVCEKWYAFNRAGKFELILNKQENTFLYTSRGLALHRGITWINELSASV